jgi:hypothetical protein
MPTPDDSDLNQEQRDRIRSRAFSRGATLRRRRTLARRSVTVAAVLAVVGGGIAAAQLTQGPGHGSRSVTPVTGATTTTLPGIGVTGLTGNGNTGITGNTGTTTSSVPGTTLPGAGDTTTSSTPPNTSSTVPVTTSTSTTTTTVPTQSSFHDSLDDVVAPGTMASATWTDPSGMTLSLSGLKVSNLGQGTGGQVRVELLTTGQAPEQLAGETIDQVKANTLQVSLQTPLTIQPGQQLALTVSCEPNQGACQVSLDFSGTMWATASLSTPDQGGALLVIVAPGTTSSGQWVVPGGETFSLTDLVLDSMGSNLSGSVRVDIYQAGTNAFVQNLVNTTFVALGKDYQEEQLSPALTIPAGDAVVLTVTCGADQPACGATGLYSGTSSNSTNPPGNTTTTTSTTTTIP